MKFENLGWVFAAGLAGLMFGSGFQGSSDKIGVVDIGKVFTDSNVVKKQNDELLAFRDAHKVMFTFMESYRLFTPEQAKRFKELSVKSDLTSVEKDELEKIKSDVMAADKEFNTLQTKASPTPEEVDKLREFNQRKQGLTSLFQQWAVQFEDELRAMQTKMRGETLDKVESAVGAVGKKQGYSIVFSKEVAPYGANDLTAEALKEMNK